MTSEEAKEIINAPGDFISVPANARQLGRAEGFLEGMKATEIQTIKHFVVHKSFCGLPCSCGLTSALALYEKAVQP